VIKYKQNFGKFWENLATVITNLFSAIPWIGTNLVESTYFLSILPIIGIIDKSARKNMRLNKNEYLLIPYSFLAFLIGLIDGDGYIQITKTTKGFIAIKLIISLHLNDLSTLEYIKSVLNLGNIYIYRDIKNPICKLIINKTDLQDILFP
jgi:hypothetical protein